MVLGFEKFTCIGALCFVLLLLGCTQVEYDNPYDPNNPNADVRYSSSVPSSSSSVEPSSSSEAESSSSVPLSSSSAVPSSSSAEPSSSSEAESSSSIAPSISSAEPSSSSSIVSSSSSYGGLCAGFVDGTEREHYGKMKKQFCDERDGKKYVYVEIGIQTWMMENLNYETASSKCYSNDDDNCDVYGRFYNWVEANTACPDNWHLPSNDEWNTLSSYVQNNSGCSNCDAAKLKATSGWNNNGNGTDEYGFSALPGGYGSSIGSFLFVGDYGYWWSATENDARYAYYRRMYFGLANVIRDDYNKSSLFSVRCLQD